MQTVRHMLDWNDIRYFLAVSRTGSSAGAARALGVNQTTVTRRIGELERALGATIFERRPDGYRVRPEAAELLSMAERLEAEVERFQSIGGALGRGLDRIRVTTNEPLANAIVAPAIRLFRGRFPNVRIDLAVSPRQLDLACGEADVALRAAALADDSDLIARKVGDAFWGVYCSRDYAGVHGPPRTLADLAGHQVLMVEDPSGTRIADLAKNAAGFDRRDTLNDLCIAARAGLGVVSLPCVLGESQADLQRCFVQSEPVTPIWLIYHQRLRQETALRALLDAVIEQAEAARDVLQGLVEVA
jgi:DNA-binding transcriptional LysR family regulator